MNESTNHSKHSFLKYLTMIPYSTLFGVWVAIIGFFAILYLILSQLSPMDGLQGLGNGSMLIQFFNSIYFSVVTSTTVGYGDIVPLGFARFLASAHSVIGYGLFAIFISKLISHRQDVSLSQIHKLTFENIFSNIREGLFIIRKDCDNAIAEAETLHTLSTRTWDNLKTAYEEGYSLMESIPQFYDHDHLLYIVDPTRERLLTEAVHRTLERLCLLLTTLNQERISWKGQKKHVEELGQFIILTDDIIAQWKTLSPHKNTTVFKTLGGSIKELKRLLKGNK